MESLQGVKSVMYSISNFHTCDSVFVIENRKPCGFGFQLNQLQAAKHLWQT